MTIPCSICNKPTQMLASGKCDTCWELFTRIEANTELAEKILTLIRITKDKRGS